MSSSFSNPVADATVKALTAVQKAHAANVAAGFEFAGRFLEQQRIATLALLDAFAATTSSRKG